MRGNVLKILTILFLLMTGIDFIANATNVDSMINYQVEIQIPSDPQMLWKAINDIDVPVVSVFIHGDETNVYANDEFYLINNYLNDQEYKNTLSSPKTFRVKSYYQKYSLKPIEETLEKRDLDSVLLLVQAPEEEFLKSLTSLQEEFKVLSYGNYEPYVAWKIIDPMVIFEFLLLMLVFLLTLYESRESFSFLKGLGISKWGIIKYQLKKKMALYLFVSISLTLINFVYLSLRFALSTVTIHLTMGLFLNQTLSLVILYIFQLIVLSIFLSTFNIVDELKIGKDYKNVQNLFILMSFLSKILFVCFLIAFSLQMPKVIEMSKVYLQWNKVNDYSTVMINNFNYLNGEKNYEANYDGALDAEERMNAVHYFEENYDAAYIVGDKEFFVPAKNNSNLKSSLLQANYNYLKLVDFPDIKKIDNTHNTLLIPEEVEQDENIYTKKLEESLSSNSDDLDVVKYSDFDFYSYDATENYEIGKNGFFENPLLFIPSRTNDNSDLYTIPFQEFYYNDPDGVAVEEYYKEYNISEENATYSYSKYDEYSTMLHVLLVKSLILIASLIFMIGLYVMTLKISLDVYMKSNTKLLSILTVVGISSILKYRVIYIENGIISIIAASIFIIGVIITPLNAVLVIEMLIYLMVDTLFINRAIRKHENKNVIRFLKGGA